MSGILDSKTRVLDTIVTLEGRKQLANGGINISYVTFTDGATFYAADLLSGSADATARLYLETCHLPQDQITFQSDFDGRLEPFGSSGLIDALIKNGQLFKADFKKVADTEVLSGSVRPMVNTQVITGSALTSAVEGLLTASVDNFKKNQIISTRDELFDDDGFGLGNKNVEFTLTRNRPIPQSQGYISSVGSLQEIFADPRFSGHPNFRYLPPVNRIDDQAVDKSDPSQFKNFLLGDYKPWGETQKVTHLDIIKELSFPAKNGFVRTVSFDPTSRNNNVFLQAFEVNDTNMFKLDIIDFGLWNATDRQQEEYQSISPNQIGSTVHILFVGKIITKPETNTSAFVHLFTMLFG